MAKAMGFSLAFMAALYICVIQEAGGATLEARNDCPFTVWAAGSPGGGKRLERGEAWTLQVPAGSTGRFWGRTGCFFNSSGRGSCNTGDCGGLLNCEGLGEAPATLLEYSLNHPQTSDFYDISIVDGFNQPMSVIPSNSQCKQIACSSNISAICPRELKVVDGCKSACAALNTSIFCCTGGYASTCSSTYYSQFFKGQCPQAYSYPLDDNSSSFSCPAGSNYTVVFCGAAPSPGALVSISGPAISPGSPAGALVSRKGSKFVLILTISGASIIALALMAVGMVVYRKKLRTKHLNEGTRITADLIIKVPNSTKSRAFTLREIMESTQNFNQKIGQGGFGSVFFGQLPEGRNIAVKVLSSFSIEGLHQFQNEVDLLSKIHHKNLVSLLGYCNGTKDVMLIYEHMSEGSLRDHLYGRCAESHQLNWKMRLKIALDAVQGLEYLHVGCTPKIIHRDVKTANILLDSNLNGKLADFGLSRITVDGEASYANTAVKGTIGYLDPEYFRTQMLTEKSDVYSFGVVLLEIICGRPPIKTNLSEEEINLIQWVTPYVEMDENSGDIDVIIDKRLDGNYDLRSILEVAKLSFRCLQAKPSSRPSASEVVTQIKEAIKLENENNNPPPIEDGNGIENRDLQVSNVHPRVESIPRKMEWADNSSNLPQVGR